MLLSLLLALMLPVGTAVGTVDKAADPRPTPMMRTVDPALVKAGEVVVIKGEHLSKDFVSAVYVTDGKRDRQVTLTVQTDDTVSFTVPAELKPGSYKVTVLLNVVEPTLVEEPVRLNVTE